MLGSLSKDEQERLTASLTDGEAAALNFEWSAWARREQLAPALPHEGWLILAGRGWGKAQVDAAQRSAHTIAAAAPTPEFAPGTPRFGNAAQPNGNEHLYYGPKTGLPPRRR